MTIPTIILNITNGCNLACAYCYYKYETSVSENTMSVGTVKTVFEKLQESCHDRFNMILHGGEPLTKGKSFFKKYLANQNKLLHSKTIQNYIQTNGTLLNEEFITEFLSNRHDFRVGLSIDGTQSVHDQNRVFKRNQ